MYVEIDEKLGYVTDEVSDIPTNQSNLNEENRIKFITDIAAVSRGKDKSNNPAKRYEMLLREAAPNEYEDDILNPTELYKDKWEVLP